MAKLILWCVVKEKTPVLMEIEDLKLITEELTNEMAQRQLELAEERSNVAMLKTEVEKLKVGFLQPLGCVLNNYQ